ncbi:MAG: FAD-dependent oxidoreductase [Vulcanimicrobiota bacterium]
MFVRNCCLLVLLLCWLPGCQNDLPSPSPIVSTTPLASPEPPPEVDVVIVGAGLSGLTTAYELKKAGLTYRILEMEPRVGGRVRTGTYPDQAQAEVGLAEFWSGNPAVELAQELQVPLEKVEPGLSSFVVDGTTYPFTTYETNQEFIKSALKDDYPAYQGWDQRMAQLIHTLEEGHPGPELLKLKDISFYDWLEEQPGLTPLARGMVRAVMEPEIGTDIRRISALDGIAEWHLFVGDGAVPWHCVGGNQKLPEALARAVGLENITLNAQATNVLDHEAGVEVRAVDTSNFQNYSFKAKYCVLTMPLYRLFEVQFEPRLSEQVYEAVHSQGWGAYFTAHCILKKEAEKYWTVDGVNFLPLLHGGPLGVIYPGHDPVGDDKIMVNLLVTGAAAEQYNSRTRSFDDVQKMIEEGMEESFPGITPMIERWTFYRYHPRAIASWPVKRSRFDELSELMRKPHGRLYFAGDFTEGTHSDGAMKSAYRVSRLIKERAADRSDQK